MGTGSTFEGRGPSGGGVGLSGLSSESSGATLPDGAANVGLRISSRIVRTSRSAASDALRGPSFSREQREPSNIQAGITIPESSASVQTKTS